MIFSQQWHSVRFIIYIFLPMMETCSEIDIRYHHHQQWNVTVTYRQSKIVSDFISPFHIFIFLVSTFILTATYTHILPLDCFVIRKKKNINKNQEPALLLVFVAGTIKKYKFFFVTFIERFVIWKFQYKKNSKCYGKLVYVVQWIRRDRNDNDYSKKYRSFIESHFFFSNIVFTINLHCRLYTHSVGGKLRT